MKRHLYAEALITVTVLGSIAIGCGSNGGGSPGAGGASPGTGGRTGAGGTTGTGGVTSSGGGTGSGGAAGNTVGGMVNGNPFNSAMTALWIGMPDPNTPPVTVVYLFEKPVLCSAITSAGWDAALPGANQDIELKAAGTTPGTYTVIGGNPAALAAGEAVINHSILMATPTEQVASAGSTITLTTLNANRNATGKFQITFPSGSLQGTFDATWCPNGREP
jgi:hypothetical protein